MRLLNLTLLYFTLNVFCSDPTLENPRVDKFEFKSGTTLNTEPRKVFTIYVSGKVVCAVAGNAGS